MDIRPYFNFDLLIEHVDEGYRARVQNSPVGEAWEPFTLPFTEAEVSASLGFASANRRDQYTPQMFGAGLYTAVFHGEVGKCLARSLDVATRERKGLRIRLRLNAVPKLAQLPWEYLHDPANNRFFVLSDQTPIVRYLEMQSSQPPLELVRPLRILVVIAKPYDFRPLNVEKEWQKVQDALFDLQQRGFVVVERLPQATLAALQEQLRQETYHILHFIGHGWVDHRARQSGLVLEDAKGSGDLVRASVLGTLLHDHRSLRLALLNACQGARMTERNSFAGTAQHLVQQGLPSVIAMQFPISDETAITLTHEFYKALAGGSPVDAALAEARKAIYGQQRHKFEWGTPVLFMRAPDGRLFEIEGVGEDAPAPGESPYKGLHYFEERDAKRFFGREKLVTDLVSDLQTERFLAIIGASGSGKSSLVRAGLIPALKRGQLSDPAYMSDVPQNRHDWLVRVITPTNHPLETLAASLTQDVESVTATETLREDLVNTPRSLHLYARKLLSRTRSSKRLLLVVDQFEELFTLCRDKSEQQAFVNNLLTATSLATDGPTLVVIALRADFYAHCSQFDELRQALERQQKYIGPMNKVELRQAIEEPARQEGWELEPGLVTQMWRDVGNEPGALPLLSHALFSTWKRRRGRKLTFAGYAASGGVHGAIARTAEYIFYQRLNEAQQAIARIILLKLTELGEETQDTRRRVAINDLIEPNKDTWQVQDVLQILANARLITMDAQSVEVAHEALIREWPTLRKWLNENREALRIHRQLNQDAKQWLALNRDEGALYRGARLTQALEWAETHISKLNTLERRFLGTAKELAQREERERKARLERELEQEQALRKAAEAQQQAEQKRAEEAERRSQEQARASYQLRRLATGLGIMFLAALIMAWYAYTQQREAERQTNIATIRQLAAQAVATVDQFPQRSLLLALENFHLTEQTDNVHGFVAHQALRNSLTEVKGIALSGHQDSISSVAISPDGQWLVTGSSDYTARLWNLSSPSAPPLILRGHEEPILDVAISPDGQWLVTASFDRTARLWNLSEPSTDPLILRGHKAAVYTVAISPDGQWLVTGSGDYTARLWDLSEPSADPLILRGHEAHINTVAFSPDGQWLVTASFDGTARLWDLSEPSTDPLILRGHEAPIYTIAISSNGQWLATGSGDRTARLWDLSKPQADPLILRGHEEPIRDVAISPDGQWLATGSDDRTARLWDLSSRSAPPLILRGHEARIIDVAISPDGQWLVTSSFDGTARLWNLSEPSADALILRGHEGGITEIAISPNGQWLVTGSGDHTARLWDLSQPSADALILRGHESSISSVAISPDGQWLVTGSYDHTARLWDLSDPSAPSAAPLILRGHEDRINTVTISPDGQWLVTGSLDRTARLWDLSEPSAAPLILRGHEDRINRVAISPNGQWLVTSSGDHTARLWDLSDPSEPPLILRGHKDRINTVAISPDGQWLVTGSTDNTARLWSLSEPLEPPLILRGHEDPITKVVISPDGQWLVTGSGDHTARLWDLSEPQADPFILRGHEEIITEIAISANGQWLVTSSDDHTARLWDLSEPQADPFILRGHESSISSVAISPDGQWLVTGSWDDTARLWDLSEQSAPPLILRGHEGPIWDVAISPDGQWLVTGSTDNTARLWTLSDSYLIDLACRAAGRNLTQTEWNQYFQGQAYRKTCDNWPAHYTVVRSLLKEAKKLAREGDIDVAISKFEEALSINPEVKIYDKDWKSICFNGSLWGYAAEVMDICERAVELVPDYGPIRDSRGLARALTRDYEGAIEDFEFYVEWSKKNGRYEEYGAQREGWIVELKAGRNPFDAETLEALKDEEDE